MPATYIEFNASGLIDGWSSDDIAAIDFQASAERIEQILKDIAPEAEIVVKWEDGSDKVFGNWKSATEEEDVRREMIDYPWYDFERWGVRK